MRICEIEGCGRKHECHGLCCAHRRKLQTKGVYGGPLKKMTGTAKLWDFVRSAAACTDKECLIWPFNISSVGYGVLRVPDGRRVVASRYICELAHGAPSDPSLEAAHDCGNSACVNPNHLSWKTHKENEKDKIRHGTVARGRSLPQTKLTEDQVLKIREMQGTMSHGKIGAMFGVTREAISSILSGRNWSHL